MKPRGALLVGLLLVLRLTVEAAATTFVPMSIEDLAASSVAVVTGRVSGLTGVESSDGTIVTLVSVDVEEVLKGDLQPTVITLKEPGGVVAERRDVVFGTPSFVVDEPVLLFLSLGGDGSLHTTQLALGKFHLELDPDGMPRAVQQFGAATLLAVVPGTKGPRPAVQLTELLDAVKRTEVAPALRPVRLQPHEATDSRLRRQSTAAFTLLGFGRFFEADLGIGLSFLIDESGDAILGLTVARQAVDDALATWTNVDAATISLADGGLTAEVNAPDISVVRFNDPNGEIDPPHNCSGTLALGGYCSVQDETKVFAGTTFVRAVRATLTLANGWQGCATWNPCNVGEVATHEIGHAIGLGHSSENVNENDPLLRGATMYYLAHFDGRCAGVRADDIAGVSFIYPTAIPPSITTLSRLPDAVALEPYSVTLAAIGGTGNFNWTLVGGTFPGLSLSGAGVLSGTPLAFSEHFSLSVKATDSADNSHTKRFDLVVNTPGGPSPTPLPTLTPTPSGKCVGDCSGNGKVTIDEILTGVNIALGLPLQTCPQFDANHDNKVTVDELLSAVNDALSGC